MIIRWKQKKISILCLYSFKVFIPNSTTYQILENLFQMFQNDVGNFLNGVIAILQKIQYKYLKQQWKI